MKNTQPGDMINKAKAKLDKSKEEMRNKMLKRAELKMSKENLLNAKQISQLQPKKRTAIMGLI